MNTTYNINYFINKFEAIPEELWLTKIYGEEDIHCALGHCGARGEDTNFRSLPEADALDKLMHYVIYINDGGDKRYQQPTPKQRILAALYDIKGQQAIKEAETIIADDPVCA